MINCQCYQKTKYITDCRLRFSDLPTALILYKDVGSGGGGLILADQLTLRQPEGVGQIVPTNYYYTPSPPHNFSHLRTSRYWNSEMKQIQIQICNIHLLTYS